MKRGFGRLIVRMISIYAVLSGCLGRNLPVASPTHSEFTATSTVLTSTADLESTKAATQPEMGNGLTPTPGAESTQNSSQPELAQVMDMQFIDAKQGWWLGATYQLDNPTWGIAIRQTMDGGVTWTPVPAPNLQPGFQMDYRNSNPNSVSRIRFVDGQTGWISGYRLYFTQDGGKEWQSVDLPGAVVALEPGGPGQSVWSIVQVCPQIPDCTAQLYQTTLDSPGLWTLVSNIPLLHPILAFVRPDSQDGYILSNGSNENYQLNLIATHDAGQSWTSISTGCISEQPLLAATDRSHLFLVCSGMPGAGNQLKEFYTSTDGGETWGLIQNPNTGHILESFGYSNALLFLTPEVGVIGLGRSSLFTTQDGGMSWTWSGIINMRDSSGWVLAAAGGQEMFAALQTTIYHSLDGGISWQSSEIH